ncbi:hypothetical protein GPECTOR_39g488 [Gonium pectorale]|uniref:Methyltransferase FkbM domain-containing protein n=1 Tax=Gonium pectorale TaxID=33097 RepID=A0A150GAZ7_GONPE|nr:hypothetical protein GPECTOR_39g488 [Gonium pectorale]|eukprot:KXZ46994.1 hypothetical protein GPECTOR_39g488 [Gonium pectorale]
MLRRLARLDCPWGRASGGGAAFAWYTQYHAPLLLPVLRLVVELGCPVNWAAIRELAASFSADVPAAPALAAAAAAAPHTGLPLSSALEAAAVDRIDLYQGVSDRPGRETVAFAYRRSSCADWNREHPDRLFADPVFHGALPRGGVFVDIGACYGDTSVPLAVLADMVVALEPNPHSFRVLELNAQLNPGLRIRPHNVAAGDGNLTELEFTYGGDMCNGGVLGAWKDASRETPLKVKAVDVPSFLRQEYGEGVLRNISLIKIDAEGFDAKIMTTLRPLLRYSKFTLLVEWFDYYVSSPPHGNEGPDAVHPGARELFDAVAGLGYVPYDPATGARVPGPQNKHKLPDLLCRPA